MGRQEIRGLIAWMDKDEAVQIQLGACMPLADENTTAQGESWANALEHLQSREEYALPTPTLEPLPEDLRARGEVFLQRADLAVHFNGWEWTVGTANLDNVLTFQKIGSEDAVERVSTIDVGDPQALFSLCLPDPGGTAELPGTVDNDRKGIAFSSANPNLRVMAAMAAAIDGQPFYGFTIGFGLPFVQVVEYQGRWFIRDGYHRCYGLLRRGVRRIPCLFIRARDTQQFGGDNPHFFRWETIFGPRPPFLRDFLDDNVAFTANRSITGRVIRITSADCCRTLAHSSEASPPVAVSKPATKGQ